jgi:FAR-17a/AIG1-like protein
MGRMSSHSHDSAHGYDLSNIFAALVLLVGAGYLLTRREPTARDDVIRGSAVASIAIVGIVFSVFLRDANLGSLVPWVNIVLHYVMPVVMVADWLTLPPKTRLTPRQIVLLLIYPAVYLAYILIRGRIVGLYPYPFLNPNKVALYGGTGGYGGVALFNVAIPAGYGGVALFCVALLVMSIVVSGLLIVLGNRVRRKV